MLYVTYRKDNGAIEHEAVEIEGKVNHHTVEKAIRDTFSYYNQYDSIDVIAWSEEEEFTPDEMEAWWKRI